MLFGALCDVYEALVDWPKRLAGEAPFYRRLFDRIGAGSVVDAACGTGHHAAMFHSWGMRVEGADLSREMIDRATARFGRPPGLHWVVRGFDEPIPVTEPFDAAVCVGNSLALAPDTDVVTRAVAAMLTALRPGGALVVQVLNLRRLHDGPCLWQRCRRLTLPQGEVVALKGVHRSGGRGFVDLAVIKVADGKLLVDESVPLLGLTPSDLESAARAAGAASVRFFGGYDEQPYDPQQSVDLIMVAER